MSAPEVSPQRAEARAHRGAGRAEREARDRIAPQVGTIRGRVLRMLVAAGDVGLTATEARDLLEAEHGEDRDLYSVAPRLSELVSDGYARQSGSYRRKKPSSPRREVYVATDAGRAWARQHAGCSALGGQS